jgi:4-hydroxy-3-polyprenylbenzoate decarboxylase
MISPLRRRERRESIVFLSVLSASAVQKASMQRLVIGITGASGVILGIRLLQVVREARLAETHLVLSTAAKATISQETDWKVSDVEALADVTYDARDVGAALASGSFRTAGMAIVPCSVKTLSAVANSYSADLVARAADVTLKEGRPLILVFRETPLHLGHIKLMERAAEIGAVILPPVPAFYARPQTIDQVVDNTVGRILLRLGIDNELYLRWAGMKSNVKRET